MMRYRVTLGPKRIVYVVLRSDHPDGFAPIELEGHPTDVEAVKQRLFVSHGIDGHLIEEKTTPVDLDVAMKGKWLRECSPERLEGDEILARYVRKVGL
jgi:hypothetical protein